MTAARAAENLLDRGPLMIWRFTAIMIALFMFCLPVNGEEYSWMFSTPGSEGASATAALPDGSVIIAGALTSEQRDDADIVLLRLSAAGELAWFRSWRGAGNDVPTAVKRAADGSLWLAGITTSGGAGSSDMLVVRFTSDGQITWTRAYGTAADDLGLDIWPTADGGAVVAGSTYSVSALSPYAVILNVNAQGDVHWRKIYGPGASATCIAELAGGSLAIGGYMVNGTHTEHLFLLTAADGEIDASWTFNGAGMEYLQALQPTTDGGALLSGATDSVGAGGVDWQLIKVDSSGAAQWSRVYGGAGDEGFPMFQLTADGGAVLAGPSTTDAPNEEHSYLLTVKVSATGAAQWQKRLALPDLAVTGHPAVQPGGYGLFGMMFSPGGEVGDLIAFTVDATGNNPACHDLEAVNLAASPVSVVQRAVELTTAERTISRAAITFNANVVLFDQTDFCNPSSPVPTRTPTSGASPTATPTPAGSPTATPTRTPVCSRTGVTLVMPSGFYETGDVFHLTAEVCNAAPSQLTGHPLFVILDVAGQYWFAPGWGQEVSYINRTYPHGTSVLEIIPEFPWPSATGSASGIIFWGAMTDSAMTSLFGEMSRIEFGFSS